MKSLLERLDIESMVKRFAEHIDIEELTREVMASLIIKDIDMYFVVEKPDGQDEYEFLGMAYSATAARKLADEEDPDRERAKIIRFDMGKLVQLVEKLGGTEVCERKS